MDTLRIRIGLLKGRKGVPLHKLAKINEETEKFLGMLGEDVKLSDPHGEWVAENFKEGSLDYDIVRPAQEEEVTNFNEALGYVIKFDPKKDEFNGVCRAATLTQFAKIGPIDSNESVRFGIYGREGNQPVEWGQLTPIQSQDILSKLEKIVEYEGAFQGRVHSLYKGGPRYHFRLRDIVTGDLINCFFDRKDYPKVIDLLEDPDAIIHVIGRIKAQKPEKKIEEMVVRKLKPAEKFLKGDLEAFFGCAPGLTGDLSTEDYIKQSRGDDE